MPLLAIADTRAGPGSLTSSQVSLPVLKRAFSEFLADKCTTMAGALAYFTLFALPSLLLVIISVAGLALGASAARGGIQAQITKLMGSGAGEQIGAIVQNASQHSGTGVLSTALGFLALVFSATTAFAQLQASLNTVWHVERVGKSCGVVSFVKTRIVSFALVVGIAVVMLALLVLSSLLSTIGTGALDLLPSAFSGPGLHILEFFVSFVVIAFLLAAIFKVLPDAELKWRQVALGGLVTSLLFTVGQDLIGLYMGKTGAGSVYGAAGSLVLIVLWIYYSAAILLFGAEFTRVLEESRGHVIVPKRGAVRELGTPSLAIWVLGRFRSKRSRVRVAEEEGFEPPSESPR